MYLMEQDIVTESDQFRYDIISQTAWFDPVIECYIYEALFWNCIARCINLYFFWWFFLFSIEEFIPLLRERMNVLNPYVRQFLVGWITVLDSVPDIDMLGFLPDFLDGEYLC